MYAFDGKIEKERGQYYEQEDDLNNYQDPYESNNNNQYSDVKYTQNSVNRSDSKIKSTNEDPKRIFFGQSEQEQYLQNKLNNLDASKEIISGVNKGISETNQNIHQSIKASQLRISDKTKSIGDHDTSINQSRFNSELDGKYNQETRRLFLKLKQEEEHLKNQVKKADENIAILNGSSVKGMKNSIIENNIKNTQIKSLKKKKENFLKRIYDINLQLDKILVLEKEDKNTILKKFEENFDKDTDAVCNIIKKHQMESKQIQENLKKDLIMVQVKRQQILEEEENKKIEEQKKILEDKKEKDKEILKKRKEELDKKMELTKQYINNKIKNEKEYLYFQFKENYENSEQNLIEEVKIKKRNAMMPIEIANEELTKKIEEEHKLKVLQAIENTKKRKEMWKNRSDILPVYHNPITKLEKMEKRRKKIKEEEIKEQKRILIEKKKEYDKSIQIPKIDDKLRKIREKNMAKPNKENILSTRNLNKQKSEVFKNFYRTYKRKNNSLQLNNNVAKEIYTNEIANAGSYSSDSNSFHIKRPRKFFLPKFSKKPKPEKPIDYLTEMRAKNSKKLFPLNRLEKSNSAKILMEEKAPDFINDINAVKNQNDYIEDKLTQKKELMNANGGYRKNPKLGDEIGKLLVESIQNKLDILNAVGSRTNAV